MRATYSESSSTMEQVTLENMKSYLARQGKLANLTLRAERVKEMINI